MDTESFKLALSMASALVAVSSAVFAYRSRKQTRLDLFETQRDLLLLTTSENDIRLKALQFRTSVLRSRLSKASARLREPSCRTTDLIEGLEELYEVARGLQRRDWSQEQIESTPYSEASMLEFRRLTLHEQVISKTIQAEVQSVLLDDAEAELARLDIVS